MGGYTRRKMGSHAWSRGGSPEHRAFSTFIASILIQPRGLVAANLVYPMSGGESWPCRCALLSSDMDDSLAGKEMFALPLPLPLSLPFISIS